MYRITYSSKSSNKKGIKKEKFIEIPQSRGYHFSTLLSILPDSSARTHHTLKGATRHLLPNNLAFSSKQYALGIFQINKCGCTHDVKVL